MHTPQYQAHFTALRDQLPGSDLPWLKTLRDEAMEGFAANGFPTRRVEGWKYTDLRPLTKRHFTLAGSDSPVDASMVKSFMLPFAGAHHLVFVDGHFVAELSELGGLPAGIRLTGLSNALNHQPDIAQAYLGRLVDLRAPGFAAFNTAFMADGSLLHLQAGTEIETPICLLYISTGDREAMASVRNLLVAERGSRVQLVERYATLRAGQYLTNVVTELFVDEQADVEHYRWEEESGQAFHLGGQFVQQARDSSYRLHSIVGGGRLVRNEVNVILEGRGSECILNGLYTGSGRQHLDNHILVEHRQPGAVSRQWFKGVLDERARGVFSGKIIVREGAQQTDALQNNKNLLLSKDAEADARPQLEIYADDVKCAHGCAVGELDRDALYYLRSRGLDKSTARSILIRAFASEVVERMPLAAVRELLEQRLNARFSYPNLMHKLDA